MKCLYENEKDVKDNLKHVDLKCEFRYNAATLARISTLL